MIKLFRAFLLICAFLVRFLWCQNLTSVTTLTSTTITPTTDNSCQPNVPGCHQEDKKGLFNSTTSEIRPQIQNGRGRTMNFTMSFQDDMRSNGLEMGLPKQKIPNIKTNTKQHSIDDVSVDEMEDDFNLNLTNTMSNIRLLNNMMNSFQMMKNISTCMDGEKIYKLGEKFNRGCDETCQCLKDGVICGQLCKTPYQVKGRNKNPECTEETLEGNSCCVRLVCTVIPDLEAEPTEDCVHKNESYKRGSIFKDGCERVCTCEAAGQVNCKARCPPVQNNTDTCLLLPDPKDPCCKILLCDVEEHDVNKMVTTVSEDINPSSENQIISAKALNSSSVAFSFAYKSKDCNMEVSSNGVNWENMICVDNIVNGLEPGKKYQFKLKNSASNKVEVTLPVQNQTSNSSCIFKGKSYKLREEFHDGCTAFCICENTGVECAPIECPTDFGLDVLDPQCLEWETHPADFVPSPPQCCPEKVQCRNNGSCIYNGETYPNWSELPTKATGCGKRCYCEMSNVTCQQMCPPVSETPPINLHCPANQAILAHPPGDECCSVWTCPNMGRTGNESITSMNKEHATNKLKIDVTPTPNSPTKYNSTQTKPNTDPQDSTNKKPYSNQPKNITDKKEFYPGPFSPQYFSNRGNTSQEQKQQKKPSHEILTDILSPFHLEKFAGEIEKELHANFTDGKEKKVKKPIIKTHFKDEDEEEGNTDDETYDEKNQYEDLFTDIFESKNKNENSSKHPLWAIKPPEIKNPNLQESTPPIKNKDLGIIKHPGAHVESPIHTADYPKKHNQEKENTLYTNKKQRPHDDNKNYDTKIPENAGNNFIPFPNVPYTIPQGIYPSNANPAVKYPPQEILIEQAQNPANHGFSHKFKPPPVSDPNQPEEFFHIIDNDAYHEDQIRQNFPYHDQHGVHPQFQQVLKLNKNGIPVQNPHEHNINVQDLLTHLHHDSNNNNVHLSNILPVHTGHQHQLPNVLHNFNFQNYHETLNTDQTSHPLLLHTESGNQAGNDSNRDEIKIHVLEAIDEATVRLVFSVPAFLVGLHGRIELRYTSDQLNNEPSTWEQQILAPPNDLIATKELEFELGGLQPNTSYKIKISVMMHDIDNAPTSSILTVKTLPPASPVTTLPAIIPVEPDLRVVEVNSTYAKVAWRMFTDFELQFIDGVQLRYKELDDKVYSATPLIHRAVTTYTIEELKPDSIYEVGIYFIPFPSQTTELQAQRTIQIKTTVENDPYKFEVTMDVHHIKSTSVEISWSGVPYPEDKYVNIFRAIYQSDGSREDYSSFKVAKRDSPQSILIQDLKPGTRYRLWLEAYLTNGRTKKSNVKDFVTKLGSLPNPSTSQGKLEGMTLVEANSYYGPLVVVSIVATLAIMSTVILLLILAKKHGTNKAPITSPINRKNNSSAAYDNPTYKVDIQQETMDL